MRVAQVIFALLALVAIGDAHAQRLEGTQITFAGSVQLDYLAIPSETHGRDIALDAATAELSLKMNFDFSEHVAASVKVCYACHGFEAGMAFIDLRVADELNFRIGRFNPSVGQFPLRHDPANHRTSDKPLPYDMGRMLRQDDWNQGVLPAPWVDTGLEINGSFFFGKSYRADYALYAISGPKGGVNAIDFDFIESRTPGRFYIDNNSEPTVGGRLGMTFDFGSTSTTLGGSYMWGHYDPNRDLYFWLAGADLSVQIMGLFLRAEYLLRKTEMFLGPTPELLFKYGPGANGMFDDNVIKEGFYTEMEAPLGPIDFVLRWDGLRRRGNVLLTSALDDRASLLRYTAALAVRATAGVRVKASVEYYEFAEFDNELALHFGVASAF
jgi:hypothetical protein